MTLKDLLRHGGRKYAVVIRTLELGFLLSLLGLLVIAVVPAVAVHVGTVLGSFGLPLAARIVALLLLISAVSLGVRQGHGLDVALHVAAWGSVAVAADVALVSGWLKRALVGGFAGLALTWVWFVADPSFAVWGALQAVRLATAGVWCVAAWEVRAGSPETQEA